MVKVLYESWDQKQRSGDQMVLLAEPESASQQVLGEEEGCDRKAARVVLNNSGRTAPDLPSNHFA